MPNRSILGWSAFAGVLVLVVAVPLNSFVSKRSIKITQELLKARDKRISVMTELIGAITFIKVRLKDERLCRSQVDIELGGKADTSTSSSLGVNSGRRERRMLELRRCGR